MSQRRSLRCWRIVFTSIDCWLLCDEEDSDAAEDTEELMEDEDMLDDEELMLDPVADAAELDDDVMLCESNPRSFK